MKRYAFIDVPNTKGSAAVLGFKIVPQLLINYLKDEKWSCVDVYWYSGRINTRKEEVNRELLTNMGYVMRDKATHFFKAKESLYFCEQCGTERKFIVSGNKTPKANCDVELTVDCLEIAGPEVQFLIFTGDGDFRYLIEKLIAKGSSVRLFSTSKSDKQGNFRLSTRLKELIKEHETSQSNDLHFIELNNIRNRIGINNKIATKRDDPEC